MALIKDNYYSHLDTLVQKDLDQRLQDIKGYLKCEVLSIYGPIFPWLDIQLKNIIEDLASKNNKKHNKCVILLDTPGGSVEVVEKMANIIRRHYQNVSFIVPYQAMSAGTILTMSGDSIYMSYHSVLGPIDPQIYKNKKFVPALSYLYQFEDLIKKSKTEPLTTPELILLEKLDLGELHTFKEARDLSIELLQKWLSKYKFKNWTKTESSKIDVSEQMKIDRAKEIAEKLSDNKRWHSHSRGVSRETLQDELNLKIDDLDTDKELSDLVYSYFDLLVEIFIKERIESYIHSYSS